MSKLQNLTTQQFQKYKESGIMFQITEKIKGKFTTISYQQNEFKVFTSLEYSIKENLIELCSSLNDSSLIIQGVLPDKEFYKLPNIDFYVFNICNINKQKYYNCYEISDMIKKLGLKHVPMLFGDEFEEFNLETNKQASVICENDTIQNIMELAKGKSALNKKVERCGIVFKDMYDPKNCFEICL